MVARRARALAFAIFADGFSVINRWAKGIAFTAVRDVIVSIDAASVAKRRSIGAATSTALIDGIFLGSAGFKRAKWSLGGALFTAFTAGVRVRELGFATVENIRSAMSITGRAR